MVLDKSPIGMSESALSNGTSGVGGSNSIAPSLPDNTKTGNSVGASAFENVLGQKLGIDGGRGVNPSTIKGAAGAAETKFEGLRFSQHALERMSNRGISFKPEDLAKLSEAVEKAAKKGSRESLILMGDNALIVSVKNKTVVTAMDRETMKENVFTNIDSTVIL